MIVNHAEEFSAIKGDVDNFEEKLFKE
jgi:hypothetical protein